MNYQRDANEIAQAAERRDRESLRERPLPSPRIVRGTLTIWEKIQFSADDPIYQGYDVHIDLNKPGLLVAYDDNGDAEIFVLQPGWYINFVPNHAGE